MNDQNNGRTVSETTVELEKQAEKQLEINYLTPADAVFSETPGGFASLDKGTDHFERVNICRAFPFSDPGRYISIRTADEKGEEIGIIDRLSDFPLEQKKIIERQLNLRYFTPKITKISSIKEEYGYSYWDTVTDRGGCRFTVSQGGVVKISELRVIISDIDGNRFEIPDISQLTPKELRLVDLYL